MEMALTDYQNAQEGADEEERDLDQIALVTTKNTLWKGMSWVIRATQIDGSEQGYSAGRVYGHQDESEQDVQVEQGIEIYNELTDIDFDSEETDDGYDPYGAGDYGFGFGPA